MRIDFHTHILPKIDDGASDTSVSLEMLQSLKEQQVQSVVLTPHYYSHRLSIPDFLENRKHAVKDFTSVVSGDLPDLYLGAEVYFSDYLFNNQDLTPLCIHGTRTMLLEFPYNRSIDSRMIDKVDRLAGEYAITPVIAHVERYSSLIHSTHSLERLLQIGCVLQVNTTSFRSFGKRRLFSLLENGYIGALGTDCHNMTSRPPCYDSEYRILEKKVSPEALEALERSMISLLTQTK